jgi:hypothetical protein
VLFLPLNDVSCRNGERRAPAPTPLVFRAWTRDFLAGDETGVAVGALRFGDALTSREEEIVEDNGLLGVAFLVAADLRAGDAAAGFAWAGDSLALTSAREPCLAAAAGDLITEAAAVFLPEIGVDGATSRRRRSSAAVGSVMRTFFSSTLTGFFDVPDTLGTRVFAGLAGSEWKNREPEEKGEMQ